MSSIKNNSGSWSMPVLLLVIFLLWYSLSLNESLSLSQLMGMWDFDYKTMTWFFMLESTEDFMVTGSF